MSQPFTQRPAFPLLGATCVILGVMVMASRWTGPGSISVIAEAATALVMQGSIALLWIGMAFGFGLVIADHLQLDRRRAFERCVVSAGLGVGFALALDALLAWLGVLMLGRGIGAWAMTIAGMLLLVVRVRRAQISLPRFRLGFTTVAAGLPIGVLLLAATSAPGWLWRTEFGGYDALSYHLQLPKEWIVGGGLATYQHNVYSALPSFVEAAFFHLFILAGGAGGGAIASQFLAAFLTILTALAVGCLARRLADPLTAGLATVMYLATPWIVVVGSLAYNDGIVGLFLAVGLLVIAKPPASSWRYGIALGILIAAACGTKLTAVGFVALPLMVAVLLRRRAQAIGPLLIAGGTATILLTSWLVRNALTTGNPTFPFLTSIFGLGHWDAEQAAIFANAHRSSAGLVEAVSRLWTHWIAFGVGTPPAPREPWVPQWAFLPALGLLGFLVLTTARSPRTRRYWALLLFVTLGTQLLFWLLATHLQSRFLVPTAIPLAIAGAGCITRLPRHVRVRFAGTLATGLGLIPLFLYFREGPAILSDGTQTIAIQAPSLRIGAAPVLFGDDAAQRIRSAPDDSTRMREQAAAPLSFLMNHLIPHDERILLVGDAQPFWYRRTSEFMTYTTVWDRGPLSEVAAKNPEHPEQWAQALYDRGYRWIVIDWALLQNWGSRGWLDPRLTKERLQAFASTIPPLQQFPDGKEMRSLQVVPASQR